MLLDGPSFVKKSSGHYSNDAHFTIPNSYHYPRCSGIPNLHEHFSCIKASNSHVDFITNSYYGNISIKPSPIMEIFKYFHMTIKSDHESVGLGV